VCDFNYGIRIKGEKLRACVSFPGPGKTRNRFAFVVYPSRSPFRLESQRDDASPEIKLSFYLYLLTPSLLSHSGATKRSSVLSLRRPRPPSRFFRQRYAIRGDKSRDDVTRLSSTIAAALL